jgi:hypothetical protein
MCGAEQSPSGGESGWTCTTLPNNSCATIERRSLWYCLQRYDWSSSILESGTLVAYDIVTRTRRSRFVTCPQLAYYTAIGHNAVTNGDGSYQSQANSASAAKGQWNWLVHNQTQILLYIVSPSNPIVFNLFDSDAYRKHCPWTKPR